jgi:hypothetical protein
MTTPEEPKELDHEAGARFLEKLLAEDPAKLDVATDEQVDAMMDAAGIEAGTPETVDELLARVERRRRERRAGPDEGVAATPKETPTTREAPRPKSAPRKGAPRVAWVAGAVVAAAAAAGIAVEVGGTAGPLAIGPDPGSTAATPRERATRLRDEAVAACGAKDFATCTAKLDDAKRLDPAGESEPRVVTARAAIAEWSMPKPAPSESAPPKVPKPK